MKIISVSNYLPNKSGITGAIGELIKSLREEKYEVDILSTHGSIRDRVKNIIKLFKDAPGCDLIMCAGCAYYGFLPILAGVTAAKLHRKKVVVDFHAGYPRPFMDYFWWIIKLVIGKSPVTVASGYLFDIFKKYQFNVFLIPYHFHYENFPQRTGKFSWNKKIMWVGSFRFMYAPETALLAARLVLQKRNDVEFHFFGRGPLWEKLKNIYSHPNIIFEGFVPRNELLKKYQEYSIFLNPSFGDNFPVRLVEAAFYELLVISARYGGTATVYNDEECLFFEKGDYKKLSEYIFEVLEKPQMYDSIRENMHKKVLGFTWEKVRDKWLGLINTQEKI